MLIIQSSKKVKGEGHRKAEKRRRGKKFKDRKIRGEFGG